MGGGRPIKRPTSEMSPATGDATMVTTTAWSVRWRRGSGVPAHCSY